MTLVPIIPLTNDQRETLHTILRRYGLMEYAEVVEEIATGRAPEKVISLISEMCDVIWASAKLDTQYSVGDWHKPSGH